MFSNHFLPNSVIRDFLLGLLMPTFTPVPRHLAHNFGGRMCGIKVGGRVLTGGGDREGRNDQEAL